MTRLPAKLPSLSIRIIQAQMGGQTVSVSPGNGIPWIDGTMTTGRDSEGPTEGPEPGDEDRNQVGTNGEEDGLQNSTRPPDSDHLRLSQASSPGDPYPEQISFESQAAESPGANSLENDDDGEYEEEHRQNKPTLKRKATNDLDCGPRKRTGDPDNESSSA